MEKSGRKLAAHIRSLDQYQARIIEKIIITDKSYRIVFKNIEALARVVYELLAKLQLYKEQIVDRFLNKSIQRFFIDVKNKDNEILEKIQELAHQNQNYSILIDILDIGIDYSRELTLIKFTYEKCPRAIIDFAKKLFFEGQKLFETKIRIEYIKNAIPITQGAFTVILLDLILDSRASISQKFELASILGENLRAIHGLTEQMKKMLIQNQDRIVINLLTHDAYKHADNKSFEYLVAEYGFDVKFDYYSEKKRILKLHIEKHRTEINRAVLAYRHS
jgi:hypothetical protein